MHCVLFLVLSTVQQTRISWAVSSKKTAPWCNSHLQKFMLEAPIPKFHCLGINLRTVQCWMNPMVITKAWQHRSIIPIRKELDLLLRSHTIIVKDPRKSIRSIAWVIGVSEFLIKQVVREDMWKEQFLSEAMKDKRKDCTTKHLKKLEQPLQLNIFWFF